MKKTMVMVLFILFLSGNLNQGYADTNPNDVAAMQVLLKSISGDLTALKWFPKTDPCTWELVTCYDGRVTAIQVGNKSLHGVLPSSLGKLTALTRLEVQNNILNGPLPYFGGNLTALQTLLLHNNQFTEMPPDFFKGMSSLEVVYLDKNPFATWQVPDSLKDCGSLVNFSANSANITGAVPDFFGTSFPSLDHLGLAYNSLTGRIPKSFFGSGMRSLWVNNQDGPGLVGDITPVSGMIEAEELWLHSNSFSGPLPDFSNLTSLKDLQLRDNQFTGIIPNSLLSLKSLDRLTLTNNLLQGAIPKIPKIRVLDLDPKSESFCRVEGGDCDVRVNVLLSVVKEFNYPVKFAENWKGNDPCNGWLGITCDEGGNITVINFQKLGLNGSVPTELSLILSVKRILLDGNHLTGVIPKEVTQLPNLKELDLSNNNLSGEVPSFSKNVLVKTDGNPNIGKDITTPKSSSGSGSDSVDVGPKSSSSSPGSSSHGKSKLVVIILCSLLGSVCLISLLFALALLYYRRRQNFARVQSPNRTVIHPRYSASDPDAIKITVAGEGTNAIGSATSEAYSLASSNRSDVHVVEAGNMVISIQVLRNVTNNFSEENVLGRGGFGTVYKGELHDGTKIAVKRMESGVMGSKGLTEFTSEIAVLTKVRHRNLVSLLGYCLDGNERLLVYEYMPQGPLSRHIFEWKEEGLKPLEWKKRLSIALDVARGVEYLHNLAHQSFIHRDLKPSNILLGDDMKAKVADFGLVRLAPDGKCCSVETRLAGTFGYLAPEYAVTGRVTTKADVFSFGVILMELITGRKALDETQPEESMHLVTWFRRMQLNNNDDKKPVQKSMIDLALNIDPEDEETLASIGTVSELAGHCCAREPNQRPDMGYAVNVLASLAELWKPSDPDFEDSYGIDLDMTLPQALKKWQGMDGATSSFFDTENTQTSIPTRPPGFADSFTSADGR